MKQRENHIIDLSKETVLMNNNSINFDNYYIEYPKLIKPNDIILCQNEQGELEYYLVKKLLYLDDENICTFEVNQLHMIQLKRLIHD